MTRSFQLLVDCFRAHLTSYIYLHVLMVYAEIELLIQSANYLLASSRSSLAVSLILVLAEMQIWAP